MTNEFLYSHFFNALLMVDSSSSSIEASFPSSLVCFPASSSDDVSLSLYLTFLVFPSSPPYSSRLKAWESITDGTKPSIDRIHTKLTMKQ